MAKKSEDEFEFIETEITDDVEDDDEDLTFIPNDKGEKDSMLKFLRDVINLKDSVKVGNLTTTDLGKCKINVRDLKQLAILSNALDMHEVADYFDLQAENILATSLSHKGFLLQTAVTQIKKQQKIKDAPPPEKKLFSFGKPKDIGDAQ